MLQKTTVSAYLFIVVAVVLRFRQHFQLSAAAEITSGSTLPESDPVRPKYLVLSNRRPQIRTDRSC